MTYELHSGGSPLLVSMPHVGTDIPPPLVAALTPRAIDVEDTDWHLHRLYDFLEEFDASVLVPKLSRYVIDLNRPPDDTPMYPGASNTELCPTRFFTGEPLHADGGAPDATERERRRALYWQPYHDALAAELVRLKSVHGYAVLWDAHSIRSEIPWLFDGVLPDLNIGTAGGTSAHPAVAEAVTAAAARNPAATHVLNGRFKGGYITRHYGNPAQQVHAVQLEMTQKLYMAESFPFAYDEQKAAAIQPTLRGMVAAAVEAARRLHGG